MLIHSFYCSNWISVNLIHNETLRYLLNCHCWLHQLVTGHFFDDMYSTFCRGRKILVQTANLQNLFYIKCWRQGKWKLIGIFLYRTLFRHITFSHSLLLSISSKHLHVLLYHSMWNKSLGILLSTSAAIEKWNCKHVEQSESR